MKFPSLTIKTKFVVLVFSVVAAFATFGLITFRTLDVVKVKGPEYDEIILGKDLTADILPPPLFIIESYLVAHELAEAKTPSVRTELESRLAQLRKDFDTRQAYWKDALSDGQMKSLILGKMTEHAHEFYSLVDNKLIPLVRAEKNDEASELMETEIKSAYTQQRADIDELVALATAFSADSEQHADHALASGTTWLTSAAIASFAFICVFSFAIARSIIKPLALLEARLKDIAEGEGDLTKRVDVTSRDEIGLVAQWFNQFVAKIEQVIAQVKSGAAQIDAGGTQIASASQSLAQGASEQASSLEQISASIEQISGQTQQAAENARQAATLAEESKKSADRGQHEMTEMNKAVSEIKQSSSEISKIIKVIDEIAFQTNLLALNAAVEAARAGEAGKGFAVVAEEVRNLAQRSAEAAKNTSAMIEESVKRSENGVAIASRVGTALEEITGATNKVNALLAEIASASGEQATGIGQVNQGVSQLDQVTQQNAGNSEELASSAEELSSQVASLNDLVSQFKVDERNLAQRAPSTPHAPAPKAASPKPHAKAATKPATHKPAKARSASTPSKPSPEDVIPMENDETLASF